LVGVADKGGSLSGKSRGGSEQLKKNPKGGKGTIGDKKKVVGYYLGIKKREFKKSELRKSKSNN